VPNLVNVKKISVWKRMLSRSFVTWLIRRRKVVVSSSSPKNDTLSFIVVLDLLVMEDGGRSFTALTTHSKKAPKKEDAAFYEKKKCNLWEIVGNNSNYLFIVLCSFCFAEMSTHLRIVL